MEDAAPPVQVEDSTGNTLLHHAVLEGDVEQVVRLVADRKLDLGAKNMAARVNNMACLRVLLADSRTTPAVVQTVLDDFECPIEGYNVCQTVGSVIGAPQALDHSKIAQVLTAWDVRRTELGCLAPTSAGLAAELATLEARHCVYSRQGKEADVAADSGWTLQQLQRLHECRHELLALQQQLFSHKADTLAPTVDELVATRTRVATRALALLQQVQRGLDVIKQQYADADKAIHALQTAIQDIRSKIVRPQDDASCEMADAPSDSVAIHSLMATSAQAFRDSVDAARTVEDQHSQIIGGDLASWQKLRIHEIEAATAFLTGVAKLQDMLPKTPTCVPEVPDNHPTMRVQEAAGSTVDAAHVATVEATRLLVCDCAMGQADLEAAVSQLYTDHTQASRAAATHCLSLVKLLSQHLVTVHQFQQWVDAAVAFWTTFSEDSAVNRKAQTLVSRVTDLKNRVHRLHDASDDLEMQVRKATRAGQTAVVKDCEKQRRKLRWAIRELERARAQGLQLLASYAHNFFPELMVHTGSLSAEARVAVVVPERNFADYEDVCNFYADPELPDMLDSDSDDPDVASHKSELREEADPTDAPTYRASRAGNQVVLRAVLTNAAVGAAHLHSELAVLGRMHHPNVLRPSALVVRNTPPDHMTLLELPVWRCSLSTWLRQQSRTPSELRVVAGNILSALVYLHNNDLTHGSLHPSSIVITMADTAAIVDLDAGLADRAARLAAAAGSADVGGAAGGSHGGSGDRAPVGYRAPELEAGVASSALWMAVDMYAFGALLYWMHKGTVPPAAGAMPHWSPETGSEPLDNLLCGLLAPQPANRPAAVEVLADPYIVGGQAAVNADPDQAIEKPLLEEFRLRVGELRGQSCRSLQLRTMQSVVVRTAPSKVRDSVLNFMSTLSGEAVRRPLVVQFLSESGDASGSLDLDADGIDDVEATGNPKPGVGQGWLLNEMFNIFFKQMSAPEAGLLATCDQRDAVAQTISEWCVPESPAPAAAAHAHKCWLPSIHAGDNEEALSKLNLFGRFLAYCCYIGRAIASHVPRLICKYLAGESPTLDDLHQFDPIAARNLRYVLATPSAVMAFNWSMRGQQVTDYTKVAAVQEAVQHILVDSRAAGLAALKTGFHQCLGDISQSVGRLGQQLSSAEWALLMCGVDHVAADAVIDCMQFIGFEPQSVVVPSVKRWIQDASVDKLRRWMLVVLGTPTVPHRTPAMPTLLVVPATSDAWVLVPDMCTLALPNLIKSQEDEGDEDKAGSADPRVCKWLEEMAAQAIVH